MYWGSWQKHLEHGFLYLKRHRLQSFISGIGISLALCLMTLSDASRAGTFRSLMKEFEGLGQGSVLIYVQDTNPLPQRFYSGLAMFCSQRDWRFIPVFERAVWVNASGYPQHSRLLFSVPEFYEVFKPGLLWGEFPDDELLGQAQLILGKDLQRRLGLGHEDSYVKVEKQWYGVTALLEGLGAGGSQIRQFLDLSDAMLVIHPEGSRPLLQENLKFALIQMNPEEMSEFRELFQQFIEREKLDHIKLDLRLPLEQREIGQRSQALLVSHGSMVSMICLFLAGMGILNAYHLQLGYRQEEFGTLIALGASSAYVAKNLLMEVLLLCMSSGILGLLLGLTSSWIIDVTAWMPMAVLPLDILFNLWILAVFAFVIAALPTWAMLKKDPILLLRVSR